MATRIKETVENHGPESVAFYLSGQLNTETQYVANKLAKGFLRTNNVESNSRLCMSSASEGYKLSFGADAPIESYGDIEESDCFFIAGSNTAECHPILFGRMLDRMKESGAPLIVVDPRKTETAKKADLHLPIRPGTDLALLNGILKPLGRMERHRSRVHFEENTEGWEEILQLVPEFDPATVAVDNRTFRSKTSKRRPDTSPTPIGG